MTDDIDQLQNSLSIVLGQDTLIALSSQDEDHNFLGAGVLEAYAVYLLVKFAKAFVEEFKIRISGAVEGAGTLLADVVFDRLKTATAGIKPFGDGKADDQKTAATAAVGSLRKAKALSAAKASFEDAIKAAKGKVVAELVSKGFSKEKAAAKVDKFVQTVMADTSN